MLKTGNIIKIVCSSLLLLSFAPPVYAVECSSKIKTSVAKAIAARDEAYMRMQVALAYEQLETTHQAQLTAKMEEKYAITVPATSYLPSIKSIVKPILEKDLEKARKDRTGESSRALKSKRRAVESAQKKYDKAFRKISSNLGCTISN